MMKPPVVCNPLVATCMRGPSHNATVNRIAQVHVAIHRAQCLQIAQRGETDHQVFLRIGERSQRTVLVGIAQDLAIEIGTISENVSVGVDESGKDSSVTQIHHLSIRGHLHLLGWTNPGNAIPFDQYHLIGGQLLGSVEQAAGADRNPVICNPMIRGRRRLSRKGSGSERAGQ
jgi:hypothetical protein